MSTILFSRRNLSLWPRRYKLLVASLCFALGLMAACVILLIPLYSKMQQLHAELAQKQRYLKHYSGRDFRVPTYSLQPHTINLDVRGGYFNLIKTIQGFNDSNHLFLIHSMQLKKQSGTSQLELKLQAKQYNFSWQSGNKVQPVIDPFQDKPVAAIGHSVVSYPLSSFALLGMIEIGQQFIAIITGPYSQVYQLKVGGQIGLEHAKVLSIQDNALTIQVPSGKAVTWQIGES